MTTIGKFWKNSVDVLRGASLFTGAIGIVNSIAHFVKKYKKYGERPSNLELFQFAASTLFFMNAVISNNTAKSIIEEAQTKTINEYRDSLKSNRQRKIFDKMSAETRRVKGSPAGNTDVIRGISKIANKDQYFADVLRINKDLNAKGMRVSITADGKVNLNAHHSLSSSELASLSKDARADMFSQLGPADCSVKNVPVLLTSSSVAANVVSTEKDHTSFINISPGEVLMIGSFIYRLSSLNIEEIVDTLHNLSIDLRNALITLCVNVLSCMLPEDIAKLRLLSPDQDLIVEVVKYVFDYLMRHRPLGEARSSDNGIVVVLKEFFQDGHVRKDTIAGLVEQFSSFIRNLADERRQQYPNKEEIVCGVCRGVRYAS